MIQLGFNLLLAWVAVFCCMGAAAIWGLRYTEKLDNAFGRLSQRLRKRLRKVHMPLGLVALVAGLVHGLLSSDLVWSLNLGTVAWVATLLLGLSFMMRKRLNQWKSWMKIHRVITIALAGLIVVHVINVGGITIHEYAYEVISGRVQSDSSAFGMSQSEIGLSDSESFFADTPAKGTSNAGFGNGFHGGHGDRTAPTATNVVEGPFKDGVYTGTADGYRPGLQVEVTVKNTQITEVRIVSHNEHGERFYGPPMQIVPEEIVAAQSTDVDTVSGATFTSVGIINAVNDALKNAGL